MSKMVDDDVIEEATPSDVAVIEQGVIEVGDDFRMRALEAFAVDRHAFEVAHEKPCWPTVLESDEAILRMRFEADPGRRKQTDEGKKGDFHVSLDPLERPLRFIENLSGDGGKIWMARMWIGLHKARDDDRIDAVGKICKAQEETCLGAGLRRSLALRLAQDSSARLFQNAEPCGADLFFGRRDGAGSGNAAGQLLRTIHPREIRDPRLERKLDEKAALPEPHRPHGRGGSHSLSGRPEERQCSCRQAVAKIWMLPQTLRLPGMAWDDHSSRDRRCP